jgi:hypothetical protein
MFSLKIHHYKKIEKNNFLTIYQHKEEKVKKISIRQ